MKEKELREKVALLRDGQVVQIEGDFFRAIKLPEYFDDSPCTICELDSICRGDIRIICDELEGTMEFSWYLKLAHR